MRSQMQYLIFLSLLIHVANVFPSTDGSVFDTGSQAGHFNPRYLEQLRKDEYLKKKQELERLNKDFDDILAKRNLPLVPARDQYHSTSIKSQQRTYTATKTPGSNLHTFDWISKDLGKELEKTQKSIDALLTRTNNRLLKYKNNQTRYHHQSVGNHDLVKQMLNDLNRYISQIDDSLEAYLKPGHFKGQESFSIRKKSE